MNLWTGDGTAKDAYEKSLLNMALAQLAVLLGCVDSLQGFSLGLSLGMLLNSFGWMCVYLWRAAKEDRR